MVSAVFAIKTEPLAAAVIPVPPKATETVSKSIVTVPDVPPPDKPVPAITPEISPTGVVPSAATNLLTEASHAKN